MSFEHVKEIEKKYSMPFTKKMVKPKNKDALVKWMLEESDRIIESKVSYHGVIYDRWRANKARKDGESGEYSSGSNPSSTNISPRYSNLSTDKTLVTPTIPRKHP